MSERTEDLARYAALIARLRQQRDLRVVAEWFPPVSEAAVRKAEQRMGYRLPLFLRLLYTEIANGGFGPVLWFTLMGLEGGCPYGWDPRYYAANYPYRKRTLEDFVLRGGPENEEGWDLPAEVEQALLQHRRDYIVYPCGTSPNATVTISDGGMDGYELDLRTGHIYVSGPDRYPVDLVEDAVLPDRDCVRYTCEYASLEELFEQTLDGNPWRPDLALDGAERYPVCLGMARPQGYVSFVPFGPPRTVAVWDRLWRGEAVSRRELTVSVRKTT